MNIEQLQARAIDTDSALISVRQSLSTARAFQLSAYEAVYLDLARREKLPLASLDERLRSVAKATGATGVSVVR